MTTADDIRTARAALTIEIKKMMASSLPSDQAAEGVALAVDYLIQAHAKQFRSGFGWFNRGGGDG